MTQYDAKPNKVPTPPELVDYRTDAKGNLTLFLKAGEVFFTRRIKLGHEAGLVVYSKERGIGSFAYGWNAKPSVRNQTCTDGTKAKLVYHKLKGSFIVTADGALLERLAAEVWPLMNADQNKCPKPYILEDVQAVQHLAEAAD